MNADDAILRHVARAVGRRVTFGKAPQLCAPPRSLTEDQGTTARAVTPSAGFVSPCPSPVVHGPTSSPPAVAFGSILRKTSRLSRIASARRGATYHR
jgi:hypothetical protein